MRPLSLRDELKAKLDGSVRGYGSAERKQATDKLVSDLEEIFKRRLCWELEELLEDIPENGKVDDVYLMIDTLVRQLRG